MQRVNRASAAVTMPAPPAGGAPGFFTGGNPGAGVPATVPGYEWFNAVQEELIAVIERGGLTPAQGNLTQVREALQRLYGGGYFFYNADVTLQPSNAGVVQMDAQFGNRVITLPLANSLNSRPIRLHITKADATANTVTIQRSGSDLIEAGTSIVLTRRYDSVILMSNTVDGWLVTRGGRQATPAETDAGVLSDVAVTPSGLGIATRSFAANGYQRLPGGLILQWGTGSTPAGGSVAVTFPIAFPNACRFVKGQIIRGDLNLRGFNASTPSASGFTAYAMNSSSAGSAENFSYFAVGN